MLVPSYVLLDREGRPLQQSAALLSDEGPAFLSLADLSGVRITLPAPAPVRSVRARFYPGGQTDSLNSWVRDLALPPAGALSLEGRAASEHRYAVAPDLTGLGPQAILIELRPHCPEGELIRELTLRFPPGPFGLMHLSLHERIYEGEGPPVVEEVADLPAYPASQAHLAGPSDPLAAQLLALGEPCVEHVWRLCLPFRGGAIIGAGDGPVAQVGWDGGLVLPCREPGSPGDRLWLKLEAGPLTRLSAPTEQRLLLGWLPVSVVRSSAGDLALTQTAFIGLSSGLHVRWLFENRGPAPATVPLRLRAARPQLIEAEGNRKVRALVHQPAPVHQQGADLTIGPLRGRLTWPGDTLALPPGGQAQIDLHLPLGDAPPLPGAAGFDEALARTVAHWTAFLEAGTRLALPDPFFQDLWRALLIHNCLFIRGGKMRYGLFPGVYEDAIFGVEEGWNIVALAQYGHRELAQAALMATFFDPEFLKKEGQHHQYRNGLALTYALDVFRLTGDRDWLRSLYPTVQGSAAWIEESLRSTRVGTDGARPPWFGLMPKHTYGGDLTEPAYSLYGSSACWRGLRDAALIAGLLDDPTTAARLSASASQARSDMHAAAGRIYKHDGTPPFLPFRIDEPGPTPGAGDYHQLFASLVLETALFGWDGHFARDITDYLSRTGRQVLGVARFDQWFGRLGIDAEYSRGFQLAHLCRRDFDAFWLGVVGQVGLSCDPFTFTSPETGIVRFTREEYQERMLTLARNPCRFDSDPCSAGTAVMLQYLRAMLAFEERDEDDLPTGRLWLLPTVPRAWFRPGQTIAATDLPTALGPLSFRCDLTADQVAWEIRFDGPVELFYFDQGGARRSQHHEVRGSARIVISRAG